MIDPTFRNINILFNLLFEVYNNDFTRNSFAKDYMSLEIKDFNASNDNNPFFDQPITTNSHMKN